MSEEHCEHCGSSYEDHGTDHVDGWYATNAAPLTSAGVMTAEATTKFP